MNARPPAPQQGAFTIQFAVVLTALLSLVGLALDFSSVYARQASMRSFAEAAALAAAHELDGTSTGVNDAVERALVILNGVGAPGADEAIRENGALQFGPTPDGPWTTPEGTAGLSPAQLDPLRFARFDTSSLEGAVTEITRFFAPGEGTTSITFRQTAVAGPTLSPILPLAVCALSKEATEARPVSGMGPELIEFGFRRGLSYNLLGLDAKGGSAAHFVVNPVEFPASGSVPNDNNFEPDVVRPFVCNGSMLHSNSNSVYVKPEFPLELFPELNSRFKLPSSCHPSVSLPDKNIMEYLNKSPSWMTTTPVPPYADPGADAATEYGPVWAFARAVQYSSTAPGHVGPAFSETAAKNLYPVAAAPEVDLTWPDNRAPPYLDRRIGTSTTPSGTSVLYRRIINVPLLNCPVTGNVATVLGIGKFMLTSRAVSSSTPPYIAAEFGGVLTSARPLMTRVYK